MGPVVNEIRLLDCSALPSDRFDFPTRNIIFLKIDVSMVWNGSRNVCMVWDLHFEFYERVGMFWYSLTIIFI